MQQRRLRLGDILDDYCPRERRVTNHVVVAMVEDDVKQTRCSTCDADHEYKQAKVPVTRRKKDAGVLFADGPTAAPRARRAEAPGAADTDAVPIAVDAEQDADAVDAEFEVETVVVEEVVVEARAAESTNPVADAVEPEPPAADDRDDWPVHRRLIRATFPRPEGQAPERKEPDFTVRQPGGGRGREVDGNRPQGGKRRNRPHRGGGQGDMQFGNSGHGNRQRGGGQGQGGFGNRGGVSQGQPGGQHRGGQPGGRDGGGRRRRGR